MPNEDIYAQELRKACILYQKTFGATTTFLAKEIGVSVAHLSNFINGKQGIGKSHYPDLEELICPRLKAYEIARTSNYSLLDLDLN